MNRLALTIITGAVLLPAAAIAQRGTVDPPIQWEDVPAAELRTLGTPPPSQMAAPMRPMPPSPPVPPAAMKKRILSHNGGAVTDRRGLVGPDGGTIAHHRGLVGPDGGTIAHHRDGRVLSHNGGTISRGGRYHDPVYDEYANGPDTPEHVGFDDGYAYDDYSDHHDYDEDYIDSGDLDQAESHHSYSAPHQYYYPGYHGGGGMITETITTTTTTGGAVKEGHHSRGMHKRKHGPMGDCDCLPMHHGEKG